MEGTGDNELESGAIIVEQHFSIGLIVFEGTSSDFNNDDLDDVVFLTDERCLYIYIKQ